MAYSPSLSLCQLSIVGGTEWQDTAWASLGGQDDQSSTQFIGLPQLACLLD